MIKKTNLPIKDYFSYMVAKIIPGLTGLLSIVLFFNILGPKEYGRYSLLFSFVNMCSAFSFGWLGQSIVRYYIKMKNNNNISTVIVNLEKNSNKSTLDFYDSKNEKTILRFY